MSHFIIRSMHCWLLHTSGHELFSWTRSNTCNNMSGRILVVFLIFTFKTLAICICLHYRITIASNWCENYRLSDFKSVLMWLSCILSHCYYLINRLQLFAPFISCSINQFLPTSGYSSITNYVNFNWICDKNLPSYLLYLHSSCRTSFETRKQKKYTCCAFV